MNLASPHELDDVHVASSAAGLDIGWDATDADARDLVYADVHTSPQDSSLAAARSSKFVARCSGSDTGRLAIPATVLGTVEEGTVTVHRVHREAFKARGIDPGEVRFDLARVIGFRR